MTDLLNYSNELPFLVPTKLSLMLCLCPYLRSFVRMPACGCLPSNTSWCSSCFVRRIYRSYSLCRPICNICLVRFLRHICFLSCSIGRCCSCICMLFLYTNYIHPYLSKRCSPLSCIISSLTFLSIES